MTPVELFHCERRDVKLTKGGCARVWESANGPEPPAPWEGKAACHLCPIGAEHAGKRLAPAAQAVHDIGPICAGCLKVSGRIIANSYCPSCYNRRLEAKRGRNAEGGVPRISALLHHEFIAVSEGQRRVNVAVSGVLGRAEAMMLMAKDCRGEMMRLGWVPLTAVHEGATIEPVAEAA